MQKTGLDGGNRFAVATTKGKSRREKKIPLTCYLHVLLFSTSLNTADYNFMLSH